MRTSLLILTMIFFCSCGSKRSEDSSNSESIIRIDLLSEPKSTLTKLSEFASNVEYVPLQTTKNSLLGEFALKIVCIDNKIYIQDNSQNNGIMCFDTQGNFLFKLQNLGRGPEEYSSITDFDVSSDNKILTIISSIDRKVLIFNLSETGTSFNGSFSLKEPSLSTISMVPGTNNAFLAIEPWKPGTPILSLLINMHGDTIQYKPNFYGSRQDKPYPRARTAIVYSNQEILCFKELFSDTVFNVDANDRSFKPRIIFDTHGTTVTPEMVGHPERMGENIKDMRGIYETSRYLFYYLLYVKNNVLNYDCLLFDKSTKTKYELDTETFIETIANIPRDVDKIKLKDDLSGGPDFTQDIRYLNRHCSGGKMFSLVDAIKFKNYVTSEGFKNARVSDSKKAELKKLADSLNETDNPVLVIVTPKK